MDLGFSPLFLLGLVAGFNFIKEWEATRYQLAREDGHKLYFRSAFWGLFVTGVTASLIAFLSAISIKTCGNQICAYFASPFESLSELVIVALLVAPFAAYVLAKLFNIFTNDLEYYLDALDGNEFEGLLVNAMTRDLMVMLTMDDNKVYVGWVYKVSDPAKEERKYFSLIPVITGFRNESRKVEFTTFYDQLYQQTNSELSHLNVEDFATVLPAHRVISCRLFDAAAYAKFQQHSSEPNEEADNVN